MQTDKIFEHTLHKELWNWLAENPQQRKDDWPRWEKNGGDIEYISSYCFACEYVDSLKQNCEACPLVWPDGCKCCTDDGALYDQWDSAECNFKLRSELALQIANLPVREGVLTR